MIVYASSPIKKIIGIVEVTEIHEGSPAGTWAKTIHGAGITEKEFLDYFDGCMTAYAIEIKPCSTIKLRTDVKPSDVKAEFRVPQSFMYVDRNFLNSVMVQGF